MISSKLRVVWRSNENNNELEILTGAAVLYSRMRSLTPRKNQWNHLLLVFSKSLPSEDPSARSTMRVFVNGKLITIRAITRHLSDSRHLYIGASPSSRYHFYGRICSVNVRLFPVPHN